MSAADLTDPGKIAQAAEAIYDERYREEYERTSSGKFVAIDVRDGQAYEGQFAEGSASGGSEARSPRCLPLDQNWRSGSVQGELRWRQDSLLELDTSIGRVTHA